MGMSRPILLTVLAGCSACLAEIDPSTNALEVVDLGNIVVEGSALSRYRPERVSGATFTDVPPEALPTVVDTLTEDFRALRRAASRCSSASRARSRSGAWAAPSRPSTA